MLINEEFEELMPRYLNFIKGIVDSDDLPLNVNRESIQQVKMLKHMSRKLVRKALDMLKKMAEEEGGEESEDEETTEEETDEPQVEKNEDDDVSGDDNKDT